MRRRAGSWLAGLALTLGGLVASSCAHAQAPAALSQPIRLTPGRRPLGAVLAEVARQSKLPLSYSSSLVPLTHRYEVPPGPARPLGEVMRDLLAAEHLRYSVLAGHLVVWPEPAASSAKRAAPGLAARSLPAGRVVTSSSSTHPTAADALRGQAVASTAVKPKARPRLVPLGPQLAGAGAASRSPLTSRPHDAPSRAIPPSRQLAQSRAVTAAPTGALATESTHQNLAPATAPRQASRDASPVVEHLTKRYAITPLPPRLAAVPVTPSPLPAALPVAVATAAVAPAPVKTLGLWRLYLHGEAWLSEGLPIGVTGKVGVLRAYAVLGAAAGPFDWPALGLGLGTAGRSRGRFTPSLELMNWFVRGENREPTNLLQLRPQLAWQLKRQGRLALVAGPTLNLATTDDRGPQRGGFGQRQWPWFDNDSDRRGARFWPGFQVGIRL